MKTFLFKIVMPTAVILLAIGESFATKVFEKKTLTTTKDILILLVLSNVALLYPVVPHQMLLSVAHQYQFNDYQAFGRFNPNDTNYLKVVYRLL